VLEAGTQQEPRYLMALTLNSLSKSSLTYCLRRTRDKRYCSVVIFQTIATQVVLILQVAAKWQQGTMANVEKGWRSRWCFSQIINVYAYEIFSSGTKSWATVTTLLNQHAYTWYSLTVSGKC